MNQEDDPELQRIKQNFKRGSPRFVIDEDGILRFHIHLCVSKNVELGKKIFEKAHNTRYLMHLGGNKIYRDLRQHFWWNNMKKEIAEYVDKCLIYQKFKMNINVRG